jgi:uncharacterized membrane protein YqgA involved in biofilm formation
MTTRCRGGARTALGGRLPERLRDTLVAALGLFSLARIRVANLLPAVLFAPLAAGLVAAAR